MCEQMPTVRNVKPKMPCLASTISQTKETSVTHAGVVTFPELSQTV